MHWVFLTASGPHIINQTNPEETVYMLNGSQTGDYSLVIPSVSLQHTGGYMCQANNSLLVVCTKFSTLDLMFLDGEIVFLDITGYLNASWELEWTQWYHQKMPQPQVLIDLSNAQVSF